MVAVLLPSAIHFIFPVPPPLPTPPPSLKQLSVGTSSWNILTRSSVAALRTSPLSSEAKWENLTGVLLFREFVFLEEDGGETAVGWAVVEEREGVWGSTE